MSIISILYRNFYFHIFQAFFIIFIQFLCRVFCIIIVLIINLALEQVKQNQDEFDLILLDYKMTLINGYDFAIKLIEVITRIKLIIIMAANDIHDNPLKLPVYFKSIDE
jgi:response regulator of citrate/malate metabolism